MKKAGKSISCGGTTKRHVYDESLTTKYSAEALAATFQNLFRHIARKQ